MLLLFGNHWHRTRCYSVGQALKPPFPPSPRSKRVHNVTGSAVRSARAQRYQVLFDTRGQRRPQTSSERWSQIERDLWRAEPDSSSSPSQWHRHGVRYSSGHRRASGTQILPRELSAHCVPQQSTTSDGRHAHKPRRGDDREARNARVSGAGRRGPAHALLLPLPRGLSLYHALDRCAYIWRELTARISYLPTADPRGSDMLALTAWS